MFVYLKSSREYHWAKPLEDQISRQRSGIGLERKKRKAAWSFSQRPLWGINASSTGAMFTCPLPLTSRLLAHWGTGAPAAARQPTPRAGARCPLLARGGIASENRMLTGQIQICFQPLWLSRPAWKAVMRVPRAVFVLSEEVIIRMIQNPKVLKGLPRTVSHLCPQNNPLSRPPASRRPLELGSYASFPGLLLNISQNLKEKSPIYQNKATQSK